MKQLVKNFVCGVLFLPILGCNQIDLAKLTQNPLAVIGPKVNALVPEKIIQEKVSPGKTLVILLRMLGLA